MKEWRVLIWGTGKVAQTILSRGINANIIGFVQSKKDIEEYRGTPVYSADNIPKNYDMILVASRFSDEILSMCIEKQIDTKNVLFLIKGKNTEYCCIDGMEDVLGEKNYVDYLTRYGKTGGYFFEEDIRKYTALNQRQEFNINRENLWPIIYDKYGINSGMTNYFFQDLWAAKKIINRGVKTHYDIGSRVDGFIAHLLAADIEVKMIDIRPFAGNVEGLKTVVDDATTMKNIEDGSVDSLSALCSLEHFGLGRYGDPIDPEACFKCFENIQNKLKKGGNLYISVPIGKERVEFNAHRIFYASTVVECFDRTKLIEFSCAAKGMIEKNVEIHRYDNDIHNGEYRYGLFHFVRN